MTVDDILGTHTPQVRDLAEQLRALILSTVTDLREKAYPGWHGIGYTHPRAGYLCAIFPRDDSVNLGFEWGVLLPDPDELLRGSGSQLRYFECVTGVPLPVDGIRRLLLDCLELPATRAERLALVQAGARPSPVT